MRSLIGVPRGKPYFRPVRQTSFNVALILCNSIILFSHIPKVKGKCYE